MEALKAFLPTVLVFLAFLAVVVGYVVLKIQGSESGELGELLPVLGGAVAGVATAGVYASSHDKGVGK